MFFISSIKLILFSRYNLNKKSKKIKKLKKSINKNLI